MQSQQKEEEGNMGNVGEVGFKRPPVHSRFRKGSSGNPKGRPRGAKNLRTDLTEVLQERITVKEGDRKKRMSKQRAIVVTLVTKTLMGDLRSANTLLNTMFRTLGNSDAADDVEQPLDADEQEVLAAIEARRQRKVEPSTKPEVPPNQGASQPDVDPDKSGSQS
jgi:Family of unknown function (DUF5681)